MLEIDLIRFTFYQERKFKKLLIFSEMTPFWLQALQILSNILVKK